MTPDGFGLNDSAFALAKDWAGNVIVGGDFVYAGGLSARAIARWRPPCRCVIDLDNDGRVENGSSPDDAVTIDDLIYFLGAFEAGDAMVDLDDDGDPLESTPDGAVDVNDIVFFLARFEAGC